jgi:hypothetical protein
MGRPNKRKVHSRRAGAISASRTRKRRRLDDAESLGDSESLGDAEPESHQIEVQEVPGSGMQALEEDPEEEGERKEGEREEGEAGEEEESGRERERERG